MTYRADGVKAATAATVAARRAHFMVAEGVGNGLSGACG